MTTITIVDHTVTRDLSHGQTEITNTEDTTITTPINMMNSVGIKEYQQQQKIENKNYEAAPFCNAGVA